MNFNSAKKKQDIFPANLLKTIFQLPYAKKGIVSNKSIPLTTSLNDNHGTSFEDNLPYPSFQDSSLFFFVLFAIFFPFREMCCYANASPSNLEQLPYDCLSITYFFRNSSTNTPLVNLNIESVEGAQNCEWNPGYITRLAQLVASHD